MAGAFSSRRKISGERHDLRGTDAGIDRIEEEAVVNVGGSVLGVHSRDGYCAESRSLNIGDNAKFGRPGIVNVGQIEKYIRTRTILDENTYRWVNRQRPHDGGGGLRPTEMRYQSGSAAMKNLGHKVVLSAP